MSRYSASFSECLKNPTGKFDIIISKLQCATDIYVSEHYESTYNMMRRMKPDLRIDRNGETIDKSYSFSDDNIIITGNAKYDRFLTVELPHKELLSINQFNTLANILLEIEKYNNKLIQEGETPCKITILDSNIIKIKKDNDSNNILEIIKELKNFISEDISISPNEEIIGEPFNISIEEETKKTL